MQVAGLFVLEIAKGHQQASTGIDFIRIAGAVRWTFVRLPIVRRLTAADDLMLPGEYWSAGDESSAALFVPNLVNLIHLQSGC